MGVEPALHALERDVTDERAVEVCGGDVGGGGEFVRALRALRDKPKARVQVEGTLTKRAEYGRWSTGQGRRIRTRTRYGGAEEAPTLGAAKAASDRETAAPAHRVVSASTVGAILKKRGMIGKPRRVRRSDPYKDRLGPYDESGAGTSRATFRSMGSDAAR